MRFGTCLSTPVRTGSNIPIEFTAWEPVRKELRARRKPADVCHGEPQILVGIHRSVVDADFVVEMGSRRASAEADVADGIAAMDVLSDSDGEARKVAVASGNAVSMVNHDSATVAAQEIGEGNGAVGRSDYGRADTGGDIDTGVKGTFSI